MPYGAGPLDIAKLNILAGLECYHRRAFASDTEPAGCLAAFAWRTGAVLKRNRTRNQPRIKQMRLGNDVHRLLLQPTPSHQHSNTQQFCNCNPSNHSPSFQQCNQYFENVPKTTNIHFFCGSKDSLIPAPDNRILQLSSSI